MLIDINLPGLGETAAHVRAKGRVACTHVADVADEAQVAAAFEAIHQSAGRVDILVNNAGIGERFRGMLHEYPARPIRLFVGTPAGGVNDQVMRMAAVDAEKKLGQPVVIENKAGASGVLSFLAIKSAAPDGYTIGVATPALWRQPILEDVAYDALKDFTYIMAPDTVKILHDAFKFALDQPAMALLERSSQRTRYMNPTDYSAFVAKATVDQRDLINRVGPGKKK
jgi:tripartite-type tricarboxylate transporter receptor subunit TctC